MKDTFGKKKKRPEDWFADTEGKIECLLKDQRLRTDRKALVREAQNVCAKGRLHLHKFVSNNREVLESIPE